MMNLLTTEALTHAPPVRHGVCVVCGGELYRVDYRFCLGCRLDYGFGVLREQQGQKRTTTGRHTNWRRVLLRDPCAYCGAPCETLDHVVPICLGGAQGGVNVTACCTRCNRLKGSTMLFQFLSEVWSLQTTPG